METIDRKIAPAFGTILRVDVQKALGSRLDNGIPVHYLDSGVHDLVKIELLFSAGMWQQPRALVASTCNALLNEGTQSLTSAQLAEKTDYYGAFMETGVDQDTASVCLYTLNKYLDETLPILEDMIKNSIFPQEELDTHTRNQKQKFRVDNEKVMVAARRKFGELMFGPEHPYGYFLKEEDFDSLTRDLLVQFHSEFYHPDNCRIIVSGKTGEHHLKALNLRFGGNDWKKKTGNKKELSFSLQTTKQNRHLVFREEALQSAIRIGRPMFNKTHPDYLPFQVLSCVLGGYFGSRLMSNIREDKGYTYGIGSATASLVRGGFFFISTEVGVEVCSKAIEEIFREIRRLRNEPVEKNELDLVRNYMLGVFQRSVDGPFALAEKLKGILEFGLDYDYYDRYVNTIKTIQPLQLQELANKYLSDNEMIELVVGKRD